MKRKCKSTGIFLAIVRIVLGLAMIYFGAMKIGAGADKQAFIGGAGHALGLTFLSITTRFWIAVVGEILAGLLLLTGCKKGAKLGALLVLIIMVFAVNVASFNLNAILVIIGALIILIAGPGYGTLCKGKCCKKCCNGKPCCDDGRPCCNNAEENCCEDNTTCCDEEDVDDNTLDSLKDTNEDIIDQAKKAGEDIQDKVEDIVETVSDTAEEIVEDVKEFAEDIGDDIEDLVDDDD